MIMNLPVAVKKIIDAAYYRSAVKSFTQKSIHIGSGNKWDNTASFDTSAGGSIILGSDNEILNGCLLMTYGGTIKIGNRCSINPYTILYGHGKGLIIGDDVLIAGHCLIVPANHIITKTDIPINRQGTYSRGIVIEDNVWIGGGCQILDGVTIGTGAVIAAGSVVNKSVEPFTIVGGVPAKFLKNRSV